MPGKPGFNTKDAEDASPNQENTFHDDGRNQADDIMAASESLYTDEWQEDSQDLDAMIEFNTFIPSEQDDDLNSDVLEVSVVTKRDRDEEQDQKGTPLTNANDYDFSKGKKFKLPCSNRQLEKMMREIGIDGIATTEASCKVKITNAVCPALRDMVVESPNFRELNFLAKLIKKMPAEEMRKFNKIVEYERQINPDITPKDIINIRYNLDNYKVHDVSGAKTVEERFQKLGAHFTPKVEGETDTDYIARMQVNGEKLTGGLEKLSGAFVSNSFVYKSDEIKSIYHSPDDIDKLSGFFSNLKNGFKFG